ncbi:MAG TPA: hypothetical protein VI566_12985 [Xanthomonadales bacterium]|nr:hypothetical protein [Xanthomonadales bacterium]
MNYRLLNGHAAASYGWIRSRLGEDGQWRAYTDRDISAYFKAPWSFFAAGDRTAAELSLAHIERNYLRPDGDFEHIVSSHLMERHPLYLHAHVAIAASLIGRPNVADRILDFTARHRHAGLEAWGGLAAAGELPHCDAVSTSTMGLACLESGRMEEANGAGRFLGRLLDMQPRPDTEFSTTLLGSGELLSGAPGVELRPHQRVTLRARSQAWWSLRFPAAFLARLFEHSGDPQWLALAQRYLYLLDRAPQSTHDMSCGKTAWACAVLYRATGDPAYRGRALQAARTLVSHLAANGGWCGCMGGDGGTAQAPTVIGYEISTEFAMWLALVGEALAAREGVAWTAPARWAGDTSLSQSLRQLQRICLLKRRTAVLRWRRVMARVL